ncbi:hypothetical protein AAC387_Pa02g2668 [Persea americana]
MGCSLVSHFSSGRSHICKLEGKERKKSFSLISDHPSTLPPLSTASDPTLLHPPPPRKVLCQCPTNVEHSPGEEELPLC